MPRRVVRPWPGIHEDRPRGEQSGVLQKIGPPGSPGEYEISGRDAHRLGADRPIGHQEREVFRRMSRSMDRADFHLAHPESVAVLELNDSALLPEIIPPLRG